jgi:phosphoserine phosphatase
MAHKRIRLVAFDMEGCLTTDPTVWEIMHRLNGTWHSHGLPYWERYLSGKIEYDEFARLDVAAWRGAPSALLDKAAAAVSLTPGCPELLSTLREARVAVAVISNGLMCAAERFRRDYGTTHVFANRAIASDAVLTGEVEILVPYAGKGELLHALACQLGLERQEIAAVGDSPSDIAMFAEARISVAFRPSEPSVAESATHVVRDGSLAPLCDIVLARFE